MSSTKLFGCHINFEPEEEEGDIIGDVSRSPYIEAMSSSVCHLGDSYSTSPHNKYIDFFARESNEVSKFGFEICNYDSYGEINETKVDLELGLGIRSTSCEVEESIMQIDSGRVEVSTNINLVTEESMVANEEELDMYSLEEEEDEELSLASSDDDDDSDEPFQFYLPVEGVMADTLLMGFEYDQFEYMEDGDSDILSGEMVDEDGNLNMVSPPASKKVVDGLPVVEITSQELRNGNIVCAICRDKFAVEGKVKRLPCKHYYHGECIVPWLGMRNTCPVCRFELPTDDDV